ncbi:hypothetical protein EON73_04520 [bacterium]|nr:MAG: hypothetical protein EON73_04520 [bacterium]
MKKSIKAEIQDHLKLWRNFNSSEIDIYSATIQASQISIHTRSITKYWHKTFEGHELLYVNATMMYGLYLEVVQGIPNGRASFIKKAS